MSDITRRPSRTAAHRRYNRLAHGLRATAVVIPGVESEEEWQRFEAHILRSLDPQGAIEVALAARVAESLWRLDRVPRAESEFVATARFRAEPPPWKEQKEPTPEREAKAYEMLRKDPYAEALVSGEAHRKHRLRTQLLPDQEDLDVLIRYEAHLNRQLYQALHELEARQARRTGEPAPLARLDVNHLTEA
jgi:hypothetical protein